MIRPPCEITDQLAVGTRNCFSTLFYTPYTNIKTSAQNASKCTIASQKIKKHFLGRGHGPLPRPRPLGAFRASILAPFALGVPVPFHLRLQHCIQINVDFTSHYITKITASKELCTVHSYAYTQATRGGGYSVFTVARRPDVCPVPTSACLPRDAMHKRGLAVSVCLSVCHVRGSRQNE